MEKEAEKLEEATSRLTSISVIGRKILDAEVSIPKTKAQQLQKGPRMDRVTNKEVDSFLDGRKGAVLCPHLASD